MSVIHFAGDAWFTRVDEGSVQEDALRIAAAVGALVRRSQPDGIVYVGYDTRTLSQGLAREVGATVAAHGLRVRVSDTHCSTAALSEATRRDAGAFAALMLTADNRSADYFGLRIFMADGSPATAADIDRLESLIEPKPPSARGDVESVDLMTSYLESVASFAGGEAIRAAAPVIVCDPMHGAMTSHAARLLASLGARVVELHNDNRPDFGGLHPEAAEPWIDECERAVVDQGAALGVALDGGGDRLAVVDEVGRPVTPHLTFALVMEHLVRVHGMQGRAVAPLFVSTVVRRQAARLGLPLTVTPAGYLWMREEMAAGDVLCAGDIFGGVCIPAAGLERDALVSAAMVCELVALDDRPLSQVVSDLDATLGHMEYGLRDVRMEYGAVQVLRNALPGVNPCEVAGLVPCEVSHPGGLMLRFENGSWLMIRPSRSFSVARVYAEAPDPAARDELLAAGAQLALAPLL